ncbi:hypothetical protein JMJ77_0007716 [Colletotrichum scovillei]|uniref:Uncharacterized protein n=1 Tax=Colletotrichum scovillei TaxID=1209932 RepID=A0A9P7RDD1_9PEZI|nr:hypothetical protein JMJ77_0007716 [Colletotrichum scovillei]KAG7074696.1 hypothetical protein JMJ76_0011170 [Colletotrichum scovillei]KAG7081935.1 hypothetical protein JMJ78_0004046 [Colletotrichum scovillei]
MAIVPRQPNPSYELPTEARSGFTKTRHDGLALSHLAATPNLWTPALAMLTALFFHDRKRCVSSSAA